jgi:hypothetical protein
VFPKLAFLAGHKAHVWYTTFSFVAQDVQHKVSAKEASCSPLQASPAKANTRVWFTTFTLVAQDVHCTGCPP